MAAVVLQGPAHSAPDLISGPFATLAEAEEARRHPRDGGYSVAQVLVDPEDAPAPATPGTESA